MFTEKRSLVGKIEGAPAQRQDGMFFHLTRQKLPDSDFLKFPVAMS
jgi:hypothetical protein